MSARKKKAASEPVLEPKTKTGLPLSTFTRPKQATRLQPKVKQARIRNKK
jgi:hypothetical protein